MPWIRPFEAACLVSILLLGKGMGKGDGTYDIDGHQTTIEVNL